MPGRGIWWKTLQGAYELGLLRGLDNPRAGGAESYSKANKKRTSDRPQAPPPRPLLVALLSPQFLLLGVPRVVHTFIYRCLFVVFIRAVASDSQQPGRVCPCSGFRTSGASGAPGGLNGNRFRRCIGQGTLMRGADRNFRAAIFGKNFFAVFYSRRTHAEGPCVRSGGCQRQL